MKLHCTIGIAEVRRALVVADSVGVIELGRQLNAPIDAALMGRIEEIWGSIKDALLAQVRLGTESVQIAASSLWETVADLLRAAGSKSKLVEECLLERIRIYVSGLQKSLLAQVQGEVVVGNIKLTLSTLEMSQAVRVEGSLKASITELLQLSSDGTLEITVSYERATKAT